MRTSLAGAALVLVIFRNWRPRILVGGRGRLKRRNPRAGGDDIWLYAPVLARPAAGKVGHHFLPIRINDEFKAIIFRSPGRDHVLGDRRTADGLKPGSRISSRELEDVGLISRRVCICVADQAVKFSGTDIIAPLRVVAPTVRTNDRSGPDRIMGQCLVARRGFIISEAVKDALSNHMRFGCNSQTVESAYLVCLAGA